MKQPLFFSICLLFASIINVQAQHQPRTPKINATQAKQHHQIHNGVKNGSITPVESAQLHHQQRNIRRTEKLAKADGVVTPRERAIINHKQKRAARNIRHQKRD